VKELTFRTRSHFSKKEKPQSPCMSRGLVDIGDGSSCRVWTSGTKVMRSSMGCALEHSVHARNDFISESAFDMCLLSESQGASDLE
jgi:hypothetical protein